MSWTKKPAAKKGVLTLTQVDTHRFAIEMDGLVIYCGTFEECRRRSDIYASVVGGRVGARERQDQAVIRAVGG